HMSRDCPQGRQQRGGDRY
ncbi:hypothetical protein KIPB_012523, partial [Kipferlia bialata]